MLFKKCMHLHSPRPQLKYGFQKVQVKQLKLWTGQTVSCSARLSFLRVLIFLQSICLQCTVLELFWSCWWWWWKPNHADNKETEVPFKTHKMALVSCCHLLTVPYWAHKITGAITKVKPLETCVGILLAWILRWNDGTRRSGKKDHMNFHSSWVCACEKSNLLTFYLELLTTFAFHFEQKYCH